MMSEVAKAPEDVIKSVWCKDALFALYLLKQCSFFVRIIDSDEEPMEMIQ